MVKKVKIVLDPFNLEINANCRSKFKIKDKSLELESVKTKIMIDTIINNNFSLKNLDISTKSLEIGSLISFIRNFKNTPELYILEKIFKKGYLISDVNLEFDDDGKIKENYTVKGLVKDAQIKFLKKYNIKDISFNFNFEEKKLELVDLSFFLNDTQLISKKLSIENVDDIFLVKGLIENKKLDLENKLLSSFLKKTFPMLDFIDLDLNSKNQFSFRLNKKFKINDLKLSSELQIVNLTLKNNLELKKFFPNIQQEINFNNHSIKVDYEKKFLSINGQASYPFKIKRILLIIIFQKKKIIDFRTNFKIDENPFILIF